MGETICYDRNGNTIIKGNRIRVELATQEIFTGTTAYNFYDEDDSNSNWLLVDLDSGESIGISIDGNNVCFEAILLD